MIYIDAESTQILEALETHWSIIKCRITKKMVNANCFDKNCTTCGSTYEYSYKSSQQIIKNMVDFIINKNNLEKIITEKPKVIFDTNIQFYEYVLPNIEVLKLQDYQKATKKERNNNPDFTIINTLIKDIQGIFKYKWFIELESTANYSAYSLADNLDIRACTYCNRTYTTTIRDKKGGKLMRPQFDHWYPESQFPLLSLSFFNLIPSCYTCNSSVKNDIILNIDDNTHPYVSINQLNDFAFSYFYDENINRYKVFLKFNKKERKAYDTMRILKVDQMYNAHISELRDLIKIKKAYSESYIQKIQELFPDVKLSKNEIYRILFGTEFDEKEFHKRPMSKFKKDILIELGIL